MTVNGINPYDSAYVFRPTSKATRPSPHPQEELNLRVLDNTKISTDKLRDNYLKAVT